MGDFFSTVECFSLRCKTSGGNSGGKHGGIFFSKMSLGEKQGENQGEKNFRYKI